MKNIYLIVSLLIVIALGYWFFIRDTRPFYEKPQFKINADHRMESRSQKYEQVEAISFLEKGGIYADSYDGIDLDKQHVIPILKSLQQQFNMQFRALVLKKDSPDYTKDRANTVFDINAALPEDPQKQEELKQAIIKAEDDFPGMITVVIGYKWISIAFMNKEEAEIFDNK